MKQDTLIGHSLQELLNRLTNSGKIMPLIKAVNIIIDVCEALAYAHSLGAIHRDIKPANIMLTDEDLPILMDFGLVKILNATSHTATGAIIGTARYMPPEIINNESPDERSDIYSLGITFFKLLTNSLPFNGKSVMSLMMMHINDPVPDLNSLRPEISPELTHIVNRSVEKDRNDRYGSADEMAGDLRLFLSALEPDSVSTTNLGYLNFELPGGW